MKVADVTINGVTLTQGQSMTLRVALGLFRTDLLECDPAGADEMERRTASAYAKNAAEVSDLLLEGCK